MSGSRRNALLTLLAALVAGGASFHFDNFWALIVSVAVVFWALAMFLPTMDAGWRFRLGFVWAVAVFSFVSVWPTVSRMSHGKVPVPAYIDQRIHFGVVKGLDLQGGMRLVYTVEVEEAIRDKRDHFAEDMRHDLAVAYGFQSGDGIMSRDTLAKLEEKLHVSTPVADSAQIRIKFTDAGDIAGKIDERFRNKFLREMGQQANPDPAELVFKIKAEEETKVRERAVAQAKDTVGRRVDELGLREASVTVRDEDIIIEVPGQDQKAFEEIKEIIRKTARLEFKMVDDETDFFAKVKDSELPEGEGLSIWQENAPAGPKRTVQTHYARMIKRDNESMLECKERFKAWVRGLNVPDDHQVGYERVLETDEDTLTQTETGWRTLYLFARADVTGDYITDASVPPPDTSNGGSQYYVALAFSPTGADRFEEVTGANVGRRFAIILDEVIDSAPRIQTKIAGGRATITMGGGDARQQLENAKKLELVLRSGALPAPITPSNETLIGPTLGQDAIGKGVTGAAVGSLFVLVFMAVYYRGSGLVADLAVIFNFVIQLAILASFSATMTLPGIAGLALTLGVAVDANVLINERIREELRAGRSVRAAVEAGYDKSFTAILDGHITVLISGLILAQYGTGPVKGFAITLIVGIVASLFTGVFCTRIVFDWWARGLKVKQLSVGIKV